MGYSKIDSVEVINFMSFKKAKVVFDETGIINLKGYNDSGKSAILRAISVCLMDKYKSKQAKFIRHGEDYFRVVVNFDDGVSIIRDKYSNGQSLYEVYKDGTSIFTTKQGNKLTKVDGVPKVIEDYLGLCVTDSVYLNYQSNEDKLPVVDTTGSENYQMFHEVLRMEEIYRANNMINSDKNELGSEIAVIEQELQRDEVLLERCGDVSEDFIKVIEGLEKEAEATDAKRKNLQGMSDIMVGLDRIPNIPSVQKVSCDRLKRVMGISDAVRKYESLPNIPKIERVDTDRLNRLSSIVNIIKALEDYKSLPLIPKVSKENISRRSELGNIVGVYEKYVNISKRTKGIDAELDQARNGLDSIIETAKSQGIMFSKCKNCGSYVVVGGEHSHGEV